MGYRSILALALLAAVHTSVSAQNVPNSFGYQGKLTTPTGQPVADGEYSVIFKVYNVPDGPNAPLFTSAPVTITTQAGLFTTSIPDVPTASLGPDRRWLETVVAGEAISPRTELTSVPYALHADQLDGLDSTAFLKSVPVPLTLSGSVRGGAIVSATNDETSTDTAGLVGHASALHAGRTFGVHGRSDSNLGGVGVFGIATATTGVGRGGEFRTKSPSGAGVAGFADANEIGGGVGVFGGSEGPDGRGVAGQVISSTGPTKAIVGECFSPAGWAGYFLGRSYFSGNVGIGTESPAMPLQITRDEPVIILHDKGLASTQSGYLGFWNNGPSETAWVGFGTPGNPDFSVVNARSSGDIVLSPLGGNVGIATASPTFKLTVNGSVAGVGAYNNLSDATLKRYVEPIDCALDKVQRLHGVSFDWKRNENPSLDFPAGRQMGFLGQEVAEVLPECVTRDDNGLISVAYGSVVPVLVEAIKEQQRQIEALQSDNRRLREGINDLKALKAQVAALVKAAEDQQAEATAVAHAR